MRENAKKVLLVFTDKSSGLDENELRSAAVELENKEVEIITVSIGDESNSSELAYITTHTGNIIDTPTDENPDKLSTEILHLIITGWFNPGSRLGIDRRLIIGVPQGVPNADPV